MNLLSTKYEFFFASQASQAEKQSTDFTDYKQITRIFF